MRSSFCVRFIFSAFSTCWGLVTLPRVSFAALNPPREAKTLRTLTFAQLAACPLFGPGEEPSLPAPITDARNQEVSVRGYLLPVRIEGGRVREFILMRDQSACCYGRMPAANEFVVARVVGATLPMIMDVPVTIQGTLRIDPVIAGGDYVQFYRFEGARLLSP